MQNVPSGKNASYYWKVGSLMARKEQVTCDVCGAQKHETNHWFVIWMSPEGVRIMDNVQFHNFTVSTRGAILLEQSRTDACGEACVLKKVSELISK